MDDLSRDGYRNALRERAPEWIGRPRPAPPSAHRRPFWPQFNDSSEPTSWVVGAGLVIAFCVTVMAVAKPILQQWRPSTVAGAAAGPAAAPASGAVSTAAAIAPPVFTSLADIDRRNRESVQRIADARREAAQQQRMADDEATRIALDTEARREREWLATYKKPPHCDDTQPSVDSIGCANDYIRARRAFDERFLASRRR